MEKSVIPHTALSAGKAAYTALVAKETGQDRAKAEWNALSKSEKLHVTTAAAIQAEPDVADKPFYWVTSTCSYAVHISPTDAAILPPSPLADKEIPRSSQARTELRAIADGMPGRNKAFIVKFLEQIIFWHHQSTNGRWNPEKNRFERYGVMQTEGWMQVEGWMQKQVGEKAHRPVSERTFRTIKNSLVDQGLIVSEVHLWQGHNCLWIRPTDALSDLVFGVEQDFVKAKAEHKLKAPLKAKPRGLSARYAALEAECKETFRMAVSGKLGPMTTAERQAIFNRLTQPIELTSTRMKPAYISPTSSKYAKLKNSLNLNPV